MALLGVQLVVTLLTISIMQKVTQRFSFGRYFLSRTGLLYYLHPMDNDLRKLAGLPIPKPPKDKPKEPEPEVGRRKRKNKGKFGQSEEKTDKSFMVPRSIDLQLEKAKIMPYDLFQLKFYPDFQWLIDYSFFAILVYVVIEIYCGLVPKSSQEVNLSMLWCFLMIGFALKSLVSVTGLYFWNNESSAERSLVLVGGSFSFVLALLLLIVDERNLEVGLEAAYESFNRSASVFLEHSPVETDGIASKLILKLCVAVWCGFTGALFVFPGLRVSRMHWDALRYFGDRPLRKALLGLNLVSPFLLCLMWIRPLARHYFSVRIFPGMDKPLMTDAWFDSMRLWLCVLLTLLRLASAPSCFQAYLNIAQTRVDDLKKEAGKISNVELQRKVAIIFYYLCVVALQYVAPILLAVGFLLMNKTLGGYSWFGQPTFIDEECGPREAEPVTLSKLLPSGEESFSDVRAHWLEALSSFRQIFTVQVYRGIFGFASWWMQFVCFASLGAGLFYQSYFTDV